MRIALTVATSALALAGCTSLDSIPTERVGEVSLSFANGLPAGTGQLLSDGRTISLAVAATGLEPGEHGFHLHTTGKCTAPDFKSAGGHLNPAGNEHGSLNPQGKHLGDLPNLVIGASRSASTEIDLGADTRALRETLFDADGTAVVIHEGADDYRSDPAGDAGSRVACGVLRPAS
ncbi:superoxide dismutase family protein [Qipengyuania sp. 1NDH17]|uniref:Superoxide dismutase family protein n=1 Tax=Qipengyuania polymorpha TaxID=2867234 RepID=A0ABS7IZ99_9SPHN|nr:superoxide dismutase family protein [Qipengyuania polymorpha]MBX7458898.1 superoxide dismutase family protein [Qipengyuania polymorpha]